uniref:Uncharacterized protein n=1 Tax=viral metagenome TaxID=1070528 RepID=A0A6C0JUV0_9ZZZZ
MSQPFPIGKIYPTISFAICWGTPEYGYSFLTRNRDFMYEWTSVDSVSIRQASAFQFTMVPNDNGDTIVSLYDTFWNAGVGTSYDSDTGIVTLGESQVGANLILESERAQFTDGLLSMSMYTFYANINGTQREVSVYDNSSGETMVLDRAYLLPTNYWRDCNNNQGVNISGRREAIQDLTQTSGLMPAWTDPQQCKDAKAYMYCDSGMYCGDDNCFGPCANGDNCTLQNNTYTCTSTVSSKILIYTAIGLAIFIVVVIIIVLLARHSAKKSQEDDYSTEVQPIKSTEE